MSTPKEAEMILKEPRAVRGKPRTKATYRSWKRSNAIKWLGVEADSALEHPQLVEKISERGEKHYVKMWDK